jgi:type II secretory pathway component PulK
MPKVGKSVRDGLARTMDFFLTRFQFALQEGRMKGQAFVTFADVSAAEEAMVRMSFVFWYTPSLHGACPGLQLGI